MPDIPEDVQAAVAEHLHDNWPHLFCDGFQHEVAGVVLEVAGPELAAHIAEAIEQHAATHTPPPAPGDPARRLRWRQHFTAAARVARSAFVAPGEFLDEAG